MANSKRSNKKFMEQIFVISGNPSVKAENWLDPVLDILDDPPGSPATGARYLVGTGTGAWAGQDDDVAEWDGSAWGFTTPSSGDLVRVQDEDVNYQFDGAAWAAAGYFVNNLNTSGTALNIADGQLGIINAGMDSNNAGVRKGDFLFPGVSAQDVPAIQIVQGTPNSADLTNVSGWETEMPACLKSGIIYRDKVMAFSGRIARSGKYSMTLASNFSAPMDETDYKGYIEIRSRRNKRDFSGNVQTIPYSVTTPDYTGLGTTSPLDHLLQSMAHQFNLQSKHASVSPSFYSNGSNPYVVFAVNISGGAGTAVGNIAVGDTIPFMQITRNGVTHTSNFIANKALITSLNEALATNLTAASTIEVIDLATAGDAAKVDALLFVGTDQEVAKAYDDIYSTKVRLDIELGDGFLAGNGYTKEIAARKHDGYGAGRQWDIRYDVRAFANLHNYQLTGHKDAVIELPNNIDVTKDYFVFILDYYDVEQSTVSYEQDQQKRVVILMEATDNATSNGIDVETGITYTNSQSNAVTDLNNILGYWLDTAKQFSAFETALDDGMDVPDPANPGSGVYFV